MKWEIVLKARFKLSFRWSISKKCSSIDKIKRRFAQFLEYGYWCMKRFLTVSSKYHAPKYAQQPCACLSCDVLFAKKLSRFS